MINCYFKSIRFIIHEEACTEEPWEKTHDIYSQVEVSTVSGLTLLISRMQILCMPQRGTVEPAQTSQWLKSWGGGAAGGGEGRPTLGGS